MAFNLAIKIYRINVTLPVSALLNQGNRLRWTSLKIKDIIAEGFSGNKDESELLRSLNLINKLNDEVLILLKKIRSGNATNNQIPELIKSYKQLKRKTEDHIYSLQSDKSDYIIPFTENVILEMAG